MTSKECSDCKLAEADARISELERAVAEKKAESQVEVKNLNVQLRYQRRLTGAIHSLPPSDAFDSALVMLLEANRTALPLKGK